MAKMWFTFKWGNGSLVSKDYLEQQLSLYYTKQEIDNFLKQYVTKIDLAGELADYLTNATYEEFRAQNAKDLQELGNNVNKNSRDITTIEQQLQSAKFVYIPNDNLNWNSGDTYKVGALVSYNNQLFLSLQNNNLNKNPETENTYWVKFDTGNVEIDLSNYYTKQEINNLLANYYTEQQVDNLLSTKQNLIRETRYWLKNIVNTYHKYNVGWGGINVLHCYTTSLDVSNAISVQVITTFGDASQNTPWKEEVIITHNQNPNGNLTLTIFKLADNNSDDERYRQDIYIKVLHAV